MNRLAAKLNNVIKEQKNISFKPAFFDFKNRKDRDEVEKLLKERKITNVVDQYRAQKQELKLIKRPALLKERNVSTASAPEMEPKQGLWIYYPWRKSLVHLLSEAKFDRVKTSRNFNLISPQEQKKFKNIKIGIAGLNVGNPAAICLALEGGAAFMKLADNDTLDLSNFNRYNASLNDLGLNKAVLTARQVAEINPFTRIELFDRGISPKNTDTFLQKPEIDVLIEEMDRLDLKISIREKAKKYRIPVIMVTGNGAGIIIDIERYDLNPKLPMLSKHLKQDVIDQVKRGVQTFEDKVRLSQDFMDKKNLVPRLNQSFNLLGKKLAGIPQVAEASFLRGAALCHFTRRLATGKPLPSGRYNLRLDTI